MLAISTLSYLKGNSEALSKYLLCSCNRGLPKTQSIQNAINITCIMISYIFVNFLIPKNDKMAFTFHYLLPWTKKIQCSTNE